MAYAGEYFDRCVRDECGYAAGGFGGVDHDVAVAGNGQDRHEEGGELGIGDAGKAFGAGVEVGEGQGDIVQDRSEICCVQTGYGLG